LPPRCPGREPRATIQEYLDVGILSFALFRATRLLDRFKAISETVESGASVWFDPERVRITLPRPTSSFRRRTRHSHSRPSDEAEKRLSRLRWRQ